MNKRIAHYMYSSIDPNHYTSLAMRVVLGMTMLVCIYTSVKYLPLVYVSLVSNLGPLLTAVFSYFYLGKGLGRLDSGVLLCSFGGVVLLILGATNDKEEPTQSLSGFYLILPIITLLA